MDEHEPVIKWFWEVLEEMDPSQRVLFLKVNEKGVDSKSRIYVEWPLIKQFPNFLYVENHPFSSTIHVIISFILEKF